MRKTRCWPLIAALVVCISGCAGATPGSARVGGAVRVLVLKDLQAIEITGARGRGVVELKRAAPGMLSVDGTVLEEPVRFRPEGELIFLNGRPYRGVVDFYGAPGGLMAINELSMETYLVGIINHEISSRWPQDAVKAQAVVSRTYAMYQIKEAQRRNDTDSPYDIEGSVLGQVYKGTGAEDAPALEAVQATAGEVITHNGELALTVFHSNAGGRTEASRDVWRRDYQYLTSVASPYDADSPGYAWEFAAPAVELGRLLSAAGYAIGEPASIRIKEQTRSGRVKRLDIKDASGRSVELSGEELRKAVGYSAVRSTIFRVERSGKVFLFKGVGSGHGVGLSQWGAKGMAEKGYSYREILRHYYPGTSIERAY